MELICDAYGRMFEALSSGVIEREDPSQMLSRTPEQVRQMLLGL